MARDRNRAVNLHSSIALLSTTKAIASTNQSKTKAIAGARCAPYKTVCKRTKSAPKVAG
ncbi:MAG: hypothetical protein F6K35_19930 [Okeania sp. SIO2H7]|nr:hypothetical protein [Okeania sp. SIO2H7]